MNNFSYNNEVDNMEGMIGGKNNVMFLGRELRAVEQRENDISVKKQYAASVYPTNEMMMAREYKRQRQYLDEHLVKHSSITEQMKEIVELAKTRCFSKCVLDDALEDRFDRILQCAHRLKRDSDDQNEIDYLDKQYKKFERIYRKCKVKIRSNSNMR